MKTPLNISFYLKKDKVKTDKTAPIYVRLGIGNGITSFSTGLFITHERWKSTKQLKLARKSEDAEIRSEIDRIRKRISSTYEDHQNCGHIISVHRLKEILLNPDIEKKRKTQTLLKLFELYNERFNQKVEVKQRSKSSFGKYETVQAHLNKFIASNYRVQDIEVRLLNFDFIDQFDFYLRKQIGLCNNTTVKYCQFLHAMIRTGIKHQWLDADPFINYDGQLEDVDTHYLTQEQLDLIAQKDFGIERLNITRDVFLFGCYTGLAPIDISQLTTKNVQKHIDGQLWILTSRQKTNINSNVPLLPPAIQIIEKYKNHPKCQLNNRLIPYSTNQTMNLYLKEIGDACKIPFSLHFYVSRHTFATTVTMSNGVSMESVSKMLGHRRITQTQHYSTIVQNKVGNEMKQVSDKYLNSPVLSEAK